MDNGINRFGIKCIDEGGNILVLLDNGVVTESKGVRLLI